MEAFPERDATSLVLIVVPQEGKTLDQVHRFIWKLLADEEFRKLALGDTAAALGKFQLSASEQSALTLHCTRLRAGQDPLAQMFSSPWNWI